FMASLCVGDQFPYLLRALHHQAFHILLRQQRLCGGFSLRATHFHPAQQAAIGVTPRKARHPCGRLAWRLWRGLDGETDFTFFIPDHARLRQAACNRMHEGRAIDSRRTGSSVYLYAEGQRRDQQHGSGHGIERGGFGITEVKREDACESQHDGDGPGGRIDAVPARYALFCYRRHERLLLLHDLPRKAAWYFSCVSHLTQLTCERLVTDQATTRLFHSETQGLQACGFGIMPLPRSRGRPHLATCRCVNAWVLPFKSCATDA